MNFLSAERLETSMREVHDRLCGCDHPGRTSYCVAGVEFSVLSEGQPKTIEIFWLRCDNCERATTTGLCGCPNPTPILIGEGRMIVPGTQE